MTIDQALRARREAVVREHVEAENRHDIEATVATFDRPRYEVMPAGRAKRWRGSGAGAPAGDDDGFPDFNAKVLRTHHADDAVICEVRMTGTHDGPWAGIPATGNRMDVPMACIFDFEEDRLVCEKLYFDLATMLRQLGALPEPANT